MCVPRKFKWGDCPSCHFVFKHREDLLYLRVLMFKCSSNNFFLYASPGSKPKIVKGHLGPCLSKIWWPLFCFSVLHLISIIFFTHQVLKWINHMNFLTPNLYSTFAWFIQCRTHTYNVLIGYWFSRTIPHTHTFHTAHVVFRWFRSGYFLAKYHETYSAQNSTKICNFLEKYMI